MSGGQGEEITVTLTTLAGHTESLSVSSSMSPSELREFACALLGFAPDDEVELTVDGKSMGAEGTPQLKNGDMVLVAKKGQVRRAAAGTARRAAAPAAARAPAPAAAGGLDFSSLLGAAPAAASASAASASSAASSSSAGGLSFNLPGLSQPSQSSAVQWAGMSLDDVVRSNPNPTFLVEVLLNTAEHPNLMKELNYHSPNLARKLRESGGGKDEAAKIWREEMMKGSIQSAYSATVSNQKESDMQARLKANPHDSEANKYFGDKIQRKNVDAQYRQMMEEYPESMGRVLMLYIESEVNGHPLQAFVDSGAQSTIMSSACAERCGLLHLLDERFEGVAVGVGTGKILGRIHIAPLKVGEHYFPCSITVMDSDGKGLGDKNMDFLFGLDMLKRHRCRIDLGKNCLIFAMGQGTMEAPFLHEKDLGENKGGTKGFDAEKSNAELERKRQEAEKKDEASDKDEKKSDAKSESKPRGDGESDAMDVDETDGGEAGKKRPNGGS